MNIIEALKDKKLLGQFIENEDSWEAWFTFLKAFFALEPNRKDRRFYKKCTGRKWPTNPALEAWLIIGTRGGKSFITALMATFLAVFKKYNLSPGEKGYIIIVAISGIPN